MPVAQFCTYIRPTTFSAGKINGSFAVIVRDHRLIDALHECSGEIALIEIVPDQPQGESGENRIVVKTDNPPCTIGIHCRPGVLLEEAWTHVTQVLREKCDELGLDHDQSREVLAEIKAPPTVAEPFKARSRRLS